jgi:4-diphosphocytidyl-2-C-methyl-D-erythritol kinase
VPTAVKRGQASGIRTANVPSFAKINLDLRVLHKRADGFHELRTVFQSISLRDTIAIEFERTKRTQFVLNSSVEIEDNIILRAAQAVLDHLRISATVRLSLSKRIPMGAGLGGGSSNAASVLLALPALAGKLVAMAELHDLASELGSDVPFFLYGGTALGIGRGTEIYPLPDLAAHDVVVVSSGIHVSTADAYRALGRPVPDSSGAHSVTNPLTSIAKSPILREFQAVSWALEDRTLRQLPLKNDFESVVLASHPDLARSLRKLKRLGANPAMMTGSGSALFGFVSSVAQAKQISHNFPQGRAHPAQFVSRSRYRNLWQRALGEAAAASVFREYQGAGKGKGLLN